MARLFLTFETSLGIRESELRVTKILGSDTGVRDGPGEGPLVTPLRHVAVRKGSYGAISKGS
jgi:hypothetical protein